jgi:PAS domain S-box-containing protein
MKKDLRILIVEDNEDDALLLLRLLQKEGYKVYYKRVELPLQMEQALEEKWDVIICDYALPKFSGLEALEIFKSKDIDIPFLLVSGTVGEDVAVDMMKSGAHDYIMKTNLKRIIPAIQRELKEVEIRRQRRIAIDSVKQSEEQYRNLITNMSEGLLQVDNNDIIQFVNKRICEMFGYEYVELIGRACFDIIVHPDEKQTVLEVTKSRLMGVASKYELKMLKKTGEIIWAEVSGSSIFDDNGNVIGSIGLITDITERRFAEENIRKLSRAVEQSPVSIIITDTNGIVEYVNPKFIEVTGYERNEVIGKNVNILKSPELKDGFYGDLWETITSGKEWSGEFLNKHKNGKLIWASASISPLKNENGEITHFISIMEDITNRKELENSLKRAIETAEESSRLKSSILANVSHELRTPMTAILGIAQILLEELEDEYVKDLISKIKKSSDRLMTTLNSILNLSEIESNSSLLYLTEYNIGRQLKNLLINYELYAKERKLNFNYLINDRNVAALVDERFMNQIIINLVDNAIKYTDKGRIDIIVEPVQREGNLFVELKVKDTGIGISDENKEVIFQEFRQASEGIARRYEGTGLGLTLAKKMIELMKGSITIESKVGKGSTFIVTLPAVELREEVKEQEVETELSFKRTSKKATDFNRKILLVEDSVINADVIIKFLSVFGKIDHAKDGSAALKMLKAKKHSLILMDINLGPGMDGVTACKRIRELPEYVNIPIVAITGYAMSADREKFLNSGFNYFIAKPFTKSQLRTEIGQVIKQYYPENSKL